MLISMDEKLYQNNFYRRINLQFYSQLKFYFAAIKNSIYIYQQYPRPNLQFIRILYLEIIYKKDWLTFGWPSVNPVGKVSILLYGK